MGRGIVDVYLLRLVWVLVLPNGLLVLCKHHIAVIQRVSARMRVGSGGVLVGKVFFLFFFPDGNMLGPYPFQAAHAWQPMVIYKLHMCLLVRLLCRMLLQDPQLALPLLARLGPNCLTGFALLIFLLALLDQWDSLAECDIQVLFLAQGLWLDRHLLLHGLESLRENQLVEVDGSAREVKVGGRVLETHLHAGVHL